MEAASPRVRPAAGCGRGRRCKRGVSNIKFMALHESAARRQYIYQHCSAVRGANERSQQRRRFIFIQTYYSDNWNCSTSLASRESQATSSPLVVSTVRASTLTVASAAHVASQAARPTIRRSRRKAADPPPSERLSATV